MSKIDSSLLSHHTFKILSSLPRHATSILTQLHTGHVRLNVFLKKTKAVDSVLCHECGQPETIAHYLLHCRRYTTQH
ncbi:hypothetical protein K439DRAFT_1351961 [Ramaria rubella]|nr:hypothetical protein K439DRAFT_1351961 [Ramaria rubella]